METAELIEVISRGEDIVASEAECRAPCEPTRRSS